MLGVLLAMASPTLSGCRGGDAAPHNGFTQVESGAHYQHLFGKRFRTKVDLYLFSFSGDPERKYVGRKDGRYPFLWAALPADVRREHIVDNGAIHILDVVPQAPNSSLPPKLMR